MKIEVKRKTWLTAVVLFMSIICAAAIMFFAATPKSAKAEDGNIGRTYYYDELRNSELAQKFYQVFDKMNTDGTFLDGKSGYDLTSMLTQSDIYDYMVNNAPKIPVALGAARDAYFMDHPDLFYVDIYKLGLSVGTDDSGAFTARLDRGRAENYYYHQDVTTAAQAKAQVDAYNKALDAVVKKVNESSVSVLDKISSANAEIAGITEYDYGALKEATGAVKQNPYVNTAYGALVDGKSLCDGYALAFKAVMDRLDIPCVLVAGSAYSGRDTTDKVTGEVLSSGFAAHMWNAVEVDGHWYVVDVTWNDTGSNIEKYVLVGEQFIMGSHVSNGVISSSGFELKYPAIRPLGYGENTDMSGFDFKDSGSIGNIDFGYTENAQTGVYNLAIGVSYNEKNLVQLAKDGLYFAYRNKSNDEWSAWLCMISFAELMTQDDKEYYDEFVASMFADKYTITNAGYSTQQLQFAVFNKKPATKDSYVYTEAESKNIVAVSVPYSNKTYMTNMPAPWAKKVTPNEKGYIASLDPQKIVIEYSESLTKVDENAQVGIAVSGSSKGVENYVKVENVVWNGDATVSFTFTPSKQYSHDCEVYRFVPTNLVGANSLKEPESASLSFRQKQVICPKVYNDGRLYMKVFGTPSFVSASDESLNDFKDNNGQPIVGDQRSQLMLVVNTPGKEQSDEMKDAAQSQLGLADGDIKASSTYQIDLHVCGFLQKVPSGSYMQVGFGFPEGYGPDDAGVTFTVYHYTRNADGTIKSVEAVPCVVTEYGIIATVKSFSPFMICAVDANSAAVKTTTKTVLAYVDGEGGSVDKKDIESLESGSITYTLTKDAGYGIYRVTFNGNDVTDKVTADGKLTLEYADLAASNTVVATFIANSVVAADKANGITRKALPDLVVEQKDMIIAYQKVSTPTAPKGSNTALIVGIVVPIVVIVLAAAGVIAFIMIRNKRKPAAATASNGKTGTAKASAQTKPAQPAKTDASARNTAARPTANAARNDSTRPAGTSRPTSTNATRKPTDSNKK